MKRLLLGLSLGVIPQLSAAPLKRPTCEDDFVPYGLEIARVAYAIQCGYIPKKMQRYYSSTFDPATQRLVKQTQFNKYPIFARKDGMRWVVWQPDKQEPGYPDTCQKPQDVEWVGSCVR